MHNLNRLCCNALSFVCSIWHYKLKATDLKISNRLGRELNLTLLLRNVKSMLLKISNLFHYIFEQYSTRVTYNIYTTSL